MMNQFQRTYFLTYRKIYLKVSDSSQDTLTKPNTAINSSGRKVVFDNEINTFTYVQLDNKVGKMPAKFIAIVSAN